MFQVNPLLAEDSHEKNHALFSSKDISKKLKCCLLQFMFGALRVKVYSRAREIDKCKSVQPFHKQSAISVSSWKLPIGSFCNDRQFPNIR